MLDQYLEKNIQNKIELFNMLHVEKNLSIADLCSLLSLSPSGIRALLAELSIDFSGLASIEKHASRFSLKIYPEVTFIELLHAIYQDSAVLHCLKFLILNDAQIALTEFMDQEFLSKSSTYRIKENCLKYLTKIGLDLNKNQVVGEEYRIRFLIALLHYKYGISCYEMTDTDLQVIHHFVLATNHTIDHVYLDLTTNEYGYFEYLLFLSWKRKQYMTAPFFSKHLDTCRKISIYKKLNPAIHEHLESALNLTFNQNDCDYIFLIYCCTNNCLFMDQLKDADLDDIHRLAFTDPVFLDLLHRIEKRFGKEIASSHIMRVSLIYFFKKSLLELQCIIPDKNFYIYSKKSDLTQIIFHSLSLLLSEWRNANQIQYEIDDGHILYLSLQIELIIKQFMPPVPIVILSELTSELELISSYLRRLFPPSRVTLKPMLLGAQTKDQVCAQASSVIITNRKFQYLFEKWDLKKCNTIVPITVELNRNELTAIQKAVIGYETEFFLNFIKQKFPLSSS